MQLQDLVRSIGDFQDWIHADKIRLFAWYVQVVLGRDVYSSSDVAKCYDELSLAPPSAIAPFLNEMERRKEALRQGTGRYKLERTLREKFDQTYGQRSATVLVQKLLADLPTRIPNLAERAYLEEAVICFRHGAFRGAIIMAWNLAYDHLCQIVLSKHLNAFNTQLAQTFTKQKPSLVAKREDFSDWKESQVVHICYAGGVITKPMYKILNEKLDRRNMFAHPSGVVLHPNTAEEFIIDLIENVVLKLQ
jgi:hypothetical protein